MSYIYLPHRRLHFREGAVTGGGGFYPYSINYSCRFNDDDSSYLHWTPGSAYDSQKKHTWSFWVKRGNITRSMLFDIRPSNVYQMSFYDDDKIWLYRYTGTYDINLKTTAVYRDVCSWYHIMLIVDTTQVTESDRVQLIVNGTRILDFDTEVYPDQDFQVAELASGNQVNIFRQGNGTYYFDGYIANIHFIDGTACTSTDFGESKNGIWIPKEYTGAYGTNGFYLDFADSADLGDDESGNGNDFTEANLDTTDQMLDTPTNNFCVLNNLIPNSGTFANGNLNISETENAFGTIGLSSGKWGWKITVAEDGSFGIEDAYGNEEVAADVNGEVVEMLLDLDSGTLKKKVDGGSLENIELSIASGIWFPYFKAQCSVDFGQIDYTPTEDGYLTICSDNLSNPSWMTDATINNPNEAFDVVTYTGNSSTQSISSLEFSPDITWIKSRSSAYSHSFWDSERGATYYLTPDTSATEGTLATGLTSFDTNGFSLGSHDLVNDDGATYVAWSWLKSATYGIDIVEYEGEASAKNVSHSLGVAPDVIFVKKTGPGTGNWCVYHSGVASDPQTDYLALDIANAAADNATIWNDTAPTDSQFTVGTSSSVNGGSNYFVAYLFAEIEGFSKFGYYIGNGNANGPFVYCGFRPKWIIIKSISGAYNWAIHDIERNEYNIVNLFLKVDTNEVEASYDTLDILSNGFKIRCTGNTWNTNTGRYIYMAFADFPLKYSNAH